MKKILLIMVIFIIGISLYKTYPLFKDRYFKEKIKETQVKQSETEGSRNSLKEISTEGEIKSDSMEITISPLDCNNECSAFKEEEKLKYCQEICGLSVQQADENCEDKSGLEKDYCLKELAIKNRDFKTCEQIIDNGVKKTCKNRITEDIMELQGGL